MKSQTVVLDTIRTWQHKALGPDDTVQKMDTPEGMLYLVTREPLFIGNPEYTMVILWDEYGPIDDTHPRNVVIHELMRSFVYQWKLTIKSIRHFGLTTYVDCKPTTETTNHEGFEWIIITAPKPDLV